MSANTYNTKLCVACALPFGYESSPVQQTHLVHSRCATTQEAATHHTEELNALRRRVKEQRREIAHLHAERDKVWETATIKVQYWRTSRLSGIVGRREQFVLRGRRVLGTITSTGRFGPVMWLAAFGAGMAKGTMEAVALIERHDTEAGALKHYNELLVQAGIIPKSAVVQDDADTVEVSPKQ